MYTLGGTSSQAWKETGWETRGASRGPLPTSQAGDLQRQGALERGKGQADESSPSNCPWGKSSGVFNQSTKVHSTQQGKIHNIWHPIKNN